MRYASPQRGFTLIELLTVIAIIAVLAAILFPLAGTVREQARASDCMTKLHQLWVSANVYRQDEGAYPPALMGYAETPDPSRPNQTLFMTDPGQAVVPLDRTINSFMYGEQVRDSGVFKCPDNNHFDKTQVTVAYFPPRPAGWPQSMPWVGESLAGVCGAGPGGLTVDCFTEGPDKGKPKFFYVFDSYDIGPLIDPTTGQPVANVYVRHYSRDWTGVEGLSDMPNQLKYDNPPDDKTILAYCTWHAAVAGSGSAPAVSMAGTAKKVNLKLLSDYGPDIYNH